jgi:uncharacterized protein YcfL
MKKLLTLTLLLFLLFSCSIEKKDNKKEIEEKISKEIIEDVEKCLEK